MLARLTSKLFYITLVLIGGFLHDHMIFKKLNTCIPEVPRVTAKYVTSTLRNGTPWRKHWPVNDISNIYNVSARLGGQQDYVGDLFIVHHDQGSQFINMLRS